MTSSLRRSALVFTIAAACALRLGDLPAAAAALPQGAQDYIKLRAKTQAVVGLRLAQARAQLKELRGKVLEMAGTITGTMSRQGDSIEGKKLISFLLNDGHGGSAIVQCTEGIPEVKAQNKVRVLVRLEPDADKLDFTPMLAIVREADLPEQWRDQERRAAAALQPPVDVPGEPGAATPANVGPRTLTTVITPAMPAGAHLAGPGTTLPVGTPDFEQKVAIYANLIKLFNAELTDAQRDLIARCLLYYSPQFDLDHRLVFAMVAAESGFNPLATSPKGAMGLGQLMPGTAAGLGVTDAYDIEQNLRGAIQYLSTQVHRYADRSNYDMFCLGMASYNAGPNRVANAGKVPNIPETIRYVNRVAKLFKELHDKGYP
ncbi:MAG: lytic transglycosylase domain-containing protein [Armatimonadota bacterium]